MSSHAASLCCEDLNTIRLDPPMNVKPLLLAPPGIGATPTFLRAASLHVSSSARLDDCRTHGPPMKTARRPPLNWSSTCWPSRSSIDLSHRPSPTRSVANLTPWTACGELIVDVLLSSLSSAPPESHTHGMRLCTRSYAFLPGPPNGEMGLPPISLTPLSFSSVAFRAAWLEKAVLGSTPAAFRASLR